MTAYGRRIVVLLLTSIATAAGETNTDELTNRDRAVVFAVRNELKAARIKNRSDVCLGFGDGTLVHDALIFTELRHALHPMEWCDHGPAGFDIAVLSPIKESAPDTFELEVQTSDLRPILGQGAHFGTLLRRGVYTIRCGNGEVPKLLHYASR